MQEVVTVKCNRCGRGIPDNERYEYLRSLFRYPVRRELGPKGTEGLTDLQKAVYKFTKNKGKATTEEVIEKFSLTQ